MLIFLAFPVWAVDLSREAGSVVKLYVTAQAWDMARPWAKGRSTKATCSGFFIEQGILTNAHCVADATFIQIEVPGLPDKIPGERVAVNHQVDLAIVRPRHPDALPDSVAPIRFGDLPEDREKVVTVGYPVGGRQVSFTEGVVSRMDVMGYAHSRMWNLLVQTDAAINPGSSGGPVFSDVSGDCVGLATQFRSRSEAIGYLIPVPVIEQFLADLKDGKVDGVPYLGILFERLENPTLREYLGMKAGQSGVMVTKVARDSSVAGAVDVDDVILSIDGKPVFNDGRIPFRKTQEIGMTFAVASHQVGDELSLAVLHDGREKKLTVALKGGDVMLIPAMPQYDARPRYYALGGLVFRTVEPRYLGRRVPFGIRQYERKTRGEGGLEELVVIGTIYEAEINKGYDRGLENRRVVNINGRPITRLDDVVRALEENDGRYHVIELGAHQLITLDRQRVEAEDEAIDRRYGISERVFLE